MQVYTIVVLTSGDKHKTDILITDFRPKKLDGTRVAETQHKIVYVCPKYVSDKTPEPYQEWLKAINDSLDKQVEESDYHNEIIQEIFSLIKKDQISPTEYARMKDEYSDEEYMQEQTQKARKEGMEKGREEGMEKGVKKGVSMMAKNMKEAEVAVETIAKVTGLSVEQIESM